MNKNLKVQVKTEEGFDLESTKSELMKELKGNEAALMMENRQEKYVQIRIGFETIQEAVLTVMKKHRMMFQGHPLDLSFCF